jgi:hypothetical protein
MMFKSKAKAKPGRGPKVPVSAGVIRDAVERFSGHCMIADAIKEVFPDARSVAVDLATIRWSDPERRERYIWLTPRSVQLALVNFDQGIRPEPFDFQLRGRMTIRMSNRRNRGRDAAAGEGLTTKEKQALAAKNTSEARKGSPKPVAERARLVSYDSGKGAVPNIEGGAAPPQHPSYGKRREFGLRSLSR